MAPSKRRQKKNVGGKTIRKTVAPKAAAKKAPSTGGVKKPRRQKPGTLPLSEIRSKLESAELPIKDLARNTAETFKRDLYLFEKVCAAYRKYVPIMKKDVKRAREIAHDFRKDVRRFKKMSAFFPKMYDKLQSNHE